MEGSRRLVRNALGWSVAGVIFYVFFYPPENDATRPASLSGVRSHEKHPEMVLVGSTNTYGKRYSSTQEGIGEGELPSSDDHPES